MIFACRTPKTPGDKLATEHSVPSQDVHFLQLEWRKRIGDLAGPGILGRENAHGGFCPHALREKLVQAIEANGYKKLSISVLRQLHTGFEGMITFAAVVKWADNLPDYLKTCASEKARKARLEAGRERSKRGYAAAKARTAASTMAIYGQNQRSYGESGQNVKESTESHLPSTSSITGLLNEDEDDADMKAAIAASMKEAEALAKLEVQSNVYGSKAGKREWYDGKDAIYASDFGGVYGNMYR